MPPKDAKAEPTLEEVQVVEAEKKLAAAEKARAGGRGGGVRDDVSHSLNSLKGLYNGLYKTTAHAGETQYGTVLWPCGHVVLLCS